MYKWNIDITLKGSGIVKRCMYIGPESGSGDVIRKLFQGKHATDYVDLYGESDKTVTYICTGEIAAIDISERKR